MYSGNVTNIVGWDPPSGRGSNARVVGSPSRTVGAADGTSVSILYVAVGGRVLVGVAEGNAEGVGPTEGSKVGKRVGDPDGGGDRG